MSQIKFRAKRLDNDEWVYGGLIWKEKPCNCAELPGMSVTQYYICYYNEDKYMFEDCEVDEHTIGQCTGVKDIHGTEIYDSDIVRNTYIMFKLHHTAVERIPCELTGKVIANIRNGSAVCRKITFRDMSVKEQEDKYEILGNIYDNPDLLEE